MDPFQHDPQFLEQFRAGAPEALERVYRLYYRPLRSFVLRGFAFQSEGRQMYFGGMAQDSDVEDVIQETFRRALGQRARRAYDGVRPYKNYLFTIARNAVITDMTVRSRQIPVGEALMRDAPSDELSPLQSWVLSQRATFDPEDTPRSEERVESLEVCGLVAAFMESLDADSERFFRVRFLGQLSQENAARAMGWNRARVRKWEARLRKAFLVHVSGSGYLEARPEARRVFRVEDPERHQSTLARSRDLWRTGRAESPTELIFEAA